MAALRKVLVPLDGSPPSLAALAHAIALAEDGDATIDVLHIDASEPPEVGSSRTLSAGAREGMTRAMEDGIAGAQTRLGSRVSRRAAQGDPLREIIAAAGEGDYDLIVMGTHGRAGRLHAILGSVAEGVVRNAPCPVLTVREPGGEYQSFAERRHGRPSLGEQVRHHHS